MNQNIKQKKSYLSNATLIVNARKMTLYTNDFFFLNGTHENYIDVITKKSALIIGFEIAKNFMDRY